MDEQALWVQQQANSLVPREDDLRHAMELLFFAYRDFTGEADAILADYGMGRAHHRAIYFIGANSGISVSELLAILKITKQSLNRVLSTLIDEGYVVQETDDGDRRRRLMHLTPKGRELEQLLTRRQSAHIARACRDAGPEAVEGFRRVLRSLVNETDRHRVTPAAGRP
jgi:DNA-binding MarR family transcriptional regulator